MITTAITTTTTTRKAWLWMLFAVAFCANACAQGTISEAQMRQDISSTITSNNNKQITGVAHRNLMLRLVTFIKGGASGIITDTSASTNYIPFFKTTGSLGSSPFRVGIGVVGLGTAASSAALLSIGTHSSGSTPNIYAPNLRLGASGGTASGIDFDGGGGDAKNGSIVNLDGTMSISAAKEVSAFGVDSASFSGGKGVFIRSATGPIRFSTGAGLGTARINITTAGNVGIGIVSAAEKLHVSGNVLASGNLISSGHISTAGTGHLLYSNEIRGRIADTTVVKTLATGNKITHSIGAINKEQVALQLKGYSGDASEDTLFSVSGDEDLMSVSAKGNLKINPNTSIMGSVGIKTLSPGYDLEVNGTLGVSQGVNLAISSGNLGVGTGSPAYKTDIAGTLRNTTSAYFATVSGNVVVGGTSAASAKLHVNGTVKSFDNSFVADADASYAGYQWANNGQTRWWLYHQGDATDNLFLARYNDAGSFLGNVLSVSRATGEIGIGTDAPSAKLHVNGTMVLTPVSAQTASDYTPVEGQIVIVNTTNATFTSLGLWSYAAGAWRK